jgi:hypothetical protein
MDISRFGGWRTAALVGSVGTVAAAVALSVTALPGAAQPTTPTTDCLTREAVLTVEEERLEEPLVEDGEPVAAQLLAAGGFDRSVERFERTLCSVRNVRAAQRLAESHGTRLWEDAVARAQGENAIGTIDAYDDRPLYWARLSMTRALRTWDAPFELTNSQRFALVRILDYASRGIPSVRLPEDPDVTRVLVSGFDTFSLDDSLRNSNPSGAAALQLDGREFETDSGRVVVESVVFPVNWTDFDQGIVEDAFGPSLEPGPQRASLIMTISQTGRGRMDIEKWAAGFRGGSPDNNRVMQFGPISRPAHWPQPFDSPQWIQTTLPYEAMIDAGTGPWPVTLNDGICEWPAGTYPDPTAIRCQPDPSEGSYANSGPGGSYLSNESMYRSNRLRQGIGAWDVPGGHLHISSLEYPEDPEALTSPQFEADRRAIVDQTVALVEAAGQAAR